jgi:hypothetical protein
MIDQPPSPPAMPAELLLLPCPFCGGPAKLVGVGAWNKCSAAYCENCEIYGPMMATKETGAFAWNRRPALSRQEQQVDKPFPTTTNTPNHSRLVGWLPVRPNGPWEQRWHGSGEDRGDHVFRNGEHVAFFGDKQHDAVSILVHVLNLWEAAK